MIFEEMKAKEKLVLECKIKTSIYARWKIEVDACFCLFIALVATLYQLVEKSS